MTEPVKDQQVEVKEVQQPQQQQVREEDERRPPLIVVLLGVAALFGFFFGWAMAPSLGVLPPGVGGGGVFPVVGVGVNGSQIFGVEVSPGAFVYTQFRICNLADRPVYVEAWVEAPDVFRVFAIYVDGGGWFGVRFGNSSRWHALFGRGECVNAKLEVLVDGKAQPGVNYVVTVHYRSVFR